MVVGIDERAIGPFRYADARARGLRPGELRSQRWQRIFRGVHTSSDDPLTLQLRSRSALMLHPADAHLSHSTAARLLEVAVPHDDEVHVTVHRRSDRHYRVGLRPHYRASSSTCVRAGGLPVSSPLQLFIELAGVLSLVDTVVAGDDMVRRRLLTARQLVAGCHAARGKNTRKARRAAWFVREGVDSPMETRVRMLLVLAGFPEPTVNHRVRDVDGTVVRRFELSYPDLRLIIEYDGRHHVERVDQWESDLERREEIDSNEWRVLVIVASGIYRNPRRTLDRVAHALRARGVRVNEYDPQWVVHFPTR